ncbi:RNA-directed DNA polymerase [Clostridium felsineum]|uniref:RNA-directed DNA polymerase n=1 Tax=Clostridium felsineum TaxID=36839 RepID=UPI00214DE859|nr:RNA-directed DNA polymerase [Clostridium felsineum]MCR3760291.1 RNA-directed DNA polymerase [Clostridium felsineum]
MSDLNKAFSKKNLLRAWRYIISNPSYQYKNFFRDSYKSYSFNFKNNISDLSNRLKNRLYIPKEPCLLLQPKNLYSTRQIILLSIEDQIVYQGIVNIIAEKSYIKLKKRYLNLTFGNLYAGKNQPFFYRKWQLCYKKLNTAIKKAYKLDYNYIASFDLTSCYDSIDHKVLSYMLTENFNVDKDLVDYLLNLLSSWSSNKGIYKSHGIPQGPISSGMLAEIFLSYFDEKFENLKQIKIKYFRYVDDIKLMSKSKENLTRMLSILDYYSKLIGVFPQTSKINIHKIGNINEELNSISVFENELSKMSLHKNPNKLESILKNCIQNNEVIKKTNFKITLSLIKPNSRITNILLDLLKYNPQYYINIYFYLCKYPRQIPNSSVKLISLLLNNINTYQIVKAFIIDAIIDKKLTIYGKLLIENSINSLFKYKNNLNPYLKYSILKYYLSNNVLTYKELYKTIKSEHSWWLQKSILKYISIDIYGEASYISILKYYLKNDNIDLSLEAVKLLIENDLEYPSYNEINYLGQQTLRDLGFIQRAKKRPSSIKACYEEICSKKLPVFNWKKELNSSHDSIEKKLFRAKAYIKSDLTAFVNILDTINDLLLDVLYTHDTCIGAYSLGHIGSVLNEKSRFAKKYPNIFLMCKTIHDKRLESDLSHPIIKSTHKDTNYIPYSYKYKLIPIICNGIKEFCNKW